MPDEQLLNQVHMMQTLVELSKEQTRLSAGRSYMNAERTLSVWIRTALASMIFGIAIDRLGLMFRGLSAQANPIFRRPDTASTITGIVLVAFSMLMALSSGWRFMAFANSYKKEYPLPAHHKAWLPVVYACMVIIFGAALLALMLWIN
jgi:putative membrane protein